jgi:hypothetical protein
MLLTKGLTMKDKKKYTVSIEQNGGEYYGWATFWASEVTQKNDTTLIADGFEIEFDEKIDEWSADSE